MTPEQQCAAENRALTERLQQQIERDPGSADEYRNMIAHLEQATRDLEGATLH